MGGSGVNKSLITSGAAVVALSALAIWYVAQGKETPAPLVFADADISAGQVLYGDFCAACHGANLEGQPDWRSPGEDGRLPAPPHDDQGHTWHHPDRVLFDYTKLGGKIALANQGVEFDSGMPGFGEDLRDEEILNILAYIKSTWPDRLREVQAERSELDNQRGEG